MPIKLNLLPTYFMLVKDKLALNLAMWLYDTDKNVNVVLLFFSFNDESFLLFLLYSLAGCLVSAPVIINAIQPSELMINFNEIKYRKPKNIRVVLLLGHLQQQQQQQHHLISSVPVLRLTLEMYQAIIWRSYQSSGTLRGQFSNYNAANVLFPPRVGITFISPIRMHILFGYSNYKSHIKSDCAKGIDRSPDSCTPWLWFNLRLH